MNMNKCPNCEQTVARVNAEAVEIVVTSSDRYRGFSYSCPNCRSVLSIQMNPLTLRDDTVGELQSSLEQIAETLRTEPRE